MDKIRALVRMPDKVGGRHLSGALDVEREALSKIPNKACSISFRFCQARSPCPIFRRAIGKRLIPWDHILGLQCMEQRQLLNLPWPRLRHLHLQLAVRRLLQNKCGCSRCNKCQC